jgi:predicted nucleic acid-binding protein
MLSVIDTNLFVGMFYDTTISSKKLFLGLENLGHQIGICAIQHHEITSVFAKRHQKRYKSVSLFQENYAIVTAALNTFYDFYDSNAVKHLDVTLPFDIALLSEVDKYKYWLLESGGIGFEDNSIKGDTNDTFFLKNCFNYEAKYLVTQDTQILRATGGEPFHKDSLSPINGRFGTFHTTEIYSKDPFLCSIIYGRLWTNKGCIDKS